MFGTGRHGHAMSAAIAAMVGCVLVPIPFAAQAAAEGAVNLPDFGPRKIFVLLFLMLGPIKILIPFVELTRGADAAFCRQLATRSILFAAAALVLAGALGRTMLENFTIPVPVLVLTGGLILFLVALQTVMQQFSQADRSRADAKPLELGAAVNRLAFPTIVTPYGIAAIIIFTTLADDLDTKLMVAGIALLILLLDWLAMLYAHAILKWAGAVLQVFAVILGVTQIALGLQIILRALRMIGLAPA